jgi:hypothetical membrane protein
LLPDAGSTSWAGELLRHKDEYKMKPYRINIFLCSLLVLLGYSIGSLLALLNFRLPYSPGENWLSDLGNSTLNPSGAIFYNAGLVITAFWLLLFFLGLFAQKVEKHKIQNLMLFLTLIFGVSGCVSMALSAFFTIDNPASHSVVSAVLYISLGTAFAFSAAALRYDPKVSKSLFVLGLLAAVVDLLTSLFFNTIPVFEWVTVFLFLAYVLLVGTSLNGPRYKPV